MADAIEHKLEGADELIKTMENIPPRLVKKNLRRATNQGATFVRDEAKRLAPRDTGRLRKNIKSKGRRGKRTYTKASVFVQVGDRTQQRMIGGQFGSGSSDFRNNPKDSWYWIFLERGTSEMPPQPFIRPAVDSQFQKVTRHVVRETDQGIKREMAQLRSAT